ncbi:D(3) dopamine receptor-like [Xenia sp. Carnegie-2017]|uniref:D(3) dopamine receptor-like n=1 Tax=Xenia sp. Carnegie-2017 TaxID=2897299 RepID=UPI001F03F812|nr:D(3) dopamine receptor-like [Xenia sp. Carnegie-2017]
MVLHKRCLAKDILPPSPIESYTIAIFSCILAMVTIPGNFLVCLAVLKTSKKNIRNPFNFFVLSLAVADLVVGCLTEPLAVYVHVKEAYKQDVEHVELELLHMSYFISCTTSVLSICLLGVERYLAIMSPLKFRLFFSIKRFLLLATIVWLISIGLSSIYLYTSYTTYALIFSTIAVLCTMGISIFTYTKILRKFKKRLPNTTVHRRRIISETSTSTEIGISSEEAHHPASEHATVQSKPTGLWSTALQKNVKPKLSKGRSFISKRKQFSEKEPLPPNPWNVKLTKTYLIIISIFLSCYFPGCVVIYTMNLCTSCSCLTLQYLQDVQFIIIAVQSAFNPFVYALRFKRFRNAVMKILKCSQQPKNHRRSLTHIKSNTTLTSTISLQSSMNVSKRVSEEL